MVNDKRVIEREIRRKWRGSRAYQDRASHRAVMQGLWGDWKHKTPLVKPFTLSLWSEEDANILQAHKRQWLDKTFQVFMRKCMRGM